MSPAWEFLNLTLYRASAKDEAKTPKSKAQLDGEKTDKEQSEGAAKMVKKS